MATLSTAQVVELYTSITGHAPDAEGLKYWKSQADNGMTTSQLATAISAAMTPENIAKWDNGEVTTYDGSDYIKGSQTPTTTATSSGATSASAAVAAVAAVVDIYKSVTGHAPDQEGLDYWVSQASKGMTTSQLTTAISAAMTPENIAKWDNGEVTTYDGSDYIKGSQTPTNTGQTDTVVDPATTVTSQDDLGFLDLLQTDKFPTTDSSSDSSSTSSSTSSSSQEASSASGLPSWFSNPLLENLLPTLIDSVSDLPGQVDSWAEKNLAASRSASKNLLDGHLTNVLADLAKRGLGNSSVASNAISNAGVDVAKDQTATDLGIMSNADQMKLSIPGILTGTANLGDASTSSSSGESSGSSNSSSIGSSVSATANPLAPYELYSQMLLGMM